MPTLLIMKGAAVDRRVPLPGAGGRLVLGRARNNDVVLDDHGMLVSRRHAEIRASASGYTVIDLGSENGVWRCGIRVAGVALESIEPIVIGPYCLLLVDVDLDPLAAAALTSVARDETMATPGVPSGGSGCRSAHRSRHPDRHDRWRARRVAAAVGVGQAIRRAFDRRRRGDRCREGRAGSVDQRRWDAVPCLTRVPRGTGVRQDVVGRYRLLERIGRGAMGEVYRGRTSADDVDLAVKILSADLEIDDAVRARFAREARAVAGLRHRNIVRLVDASLDDDPPFIVMEFLRGRSLAARLAEGPPPGIGLALDIAVQLCEGLHYAHEHGVVHRDVKPANIWLEENHAQAPRLRRRAHRRHGSDTARRVRGQSRLHRA